MPDDQISEVLKSLAWEAKRLGFTADPSRGDGVLEMQVPNGKRLTFETRFIHNEGRALVIAHNGSGLTTRRITRDTWIHQGTDAEHREALKWLRNVVRRATAVKP